MIFVKQKPTAVSGIHQLLEFAAQDFHLLVIQNANPLQVTVFVKEPNLFFVKATAINVLRTRDSSEQLANGVMVFR